jgi:hypothetical protein
MEKITLRYLGHFYDRGVQKHAYLTEKLTPQRFEVIRGFCEYPPKNNEQLFVVREKFYGENAVCVYNLDSDTLFIKEG